MELRDFKSSWEIYSRSKGTSIEGLEKILSEKLASAKTRISNKMKWDAILMLLVTGVAITLLYLLKLEYWVGGALTLTTAALLLFIHYHFMNALLNKRHKGESVIKQAGLALTALLNYTRLFQWVSPIFLSGIFYLGWYFDIYTLLGIVEDNQGIIVQVLYTFLFGAFIWLALWVIIRSSFHAEIKHLRDLISQMEMD